MKVSKKFAWRLVNAAVDEAIAKFGGSATDRAIWAKIAWRVGADAFVDAIFQGESELAEKRKRVPNEQLPRFFQYVLNRRFPRKKAEGKENIPPMYPYKRKARVKK